MRTFRRMVRTTIKVSPETKKKLDNIEGPSYDSKINKLLGVHKVDGKVYLTKEEIESLIDEKIDNAKRGF